MSGKQSAATGYVGSLVCLMMASSLSSCGVKQDEGRDDKPNIVLSVGKVFQEDHHPAVYVQVRNAELYDLAFAKLDCDFFDSTNVRTESGSNSTMEMMAGSEKNIEVIGDEAFREASRAECSVTNSSRRN